jgi:general stress protein 26
MDTPQASRPHMPGYGTLGPTEGSGLLPWSWAEERLTSSRNYWVVSLWPDGRPHAMPVWGIWDDGSFWFTSSRQSRKARNVAGDPRCVVTTEDTQDPIVVEGTAEIVTAAEALAGLIELVNVKYSTNYSVEMLDPAVSATIRVQPRWAFSLKQEDFSGSPTRWIFQQ